MSSTMIAKAEPVPEQAEPEHEEDKEEEEEGGESVHDRASTLIDGVFDGATESIDSFRQGAVAGLATGGGTTVSDEQEHGYALDGKGKMTGTQKLTQRGGASGVGTHRLDEQQGRSGRAFTSSETETEGLAGAQWAAAFLQKASPEELAAGIDVLARAGAFGSVRQKVAIRKGKMQAQSEAKASSGAGVEAFVKGAASATKSRVPIVDRHFVTQLEAAIQIGIKAGLWADGEWTGSASYGPNVMVSAFARVNGLIGAELEMSGRAWLGLKGGGVEWELDAFVGARGKAEAGVAVKLGPADLELSGTAEAMAGAEANTQGTFSFGPSGVTAKAQASAFAGVKAKVTGTAGLKIRGRQIISVTGKVSVYAGAGGEVKGEFTIDKGVIKLSAELSAALGVGFGTGADAEVDAAALGTAVAAGVKEFVTGQGPIAQNSPSFTRTRIEDPARAAEVEEMGYQAVIDEFLIYGAHKEENGNNVVKKEKVQQLISNAATFHADQMRYLEFDRGIERAAREAFPGQLKTIVVDAGHIRGWDVVSGADLAAFKKKSAESIAQDRARDKLAADLTAYGEKTRAAKTLGPVSQAEVQKIIDKHLPALRAAFVFGGAVDKAILDAADGLVDTWLDGFSVKTYKITRFAVRDLKEVKAEKDDAARQPGLAKLRQAMATYRAELVADPKATAPDPKRVQKAYDSAAKTAAASFGDAQSNIQAAAAITAGLTGLVSGVIVGGGLVTYRNVENGLATARAEAAASARQQSIARAASAFRVALAAYKEKKLGQGKSGLKPDVIDKELKTALKGLTLSGLTDAERADLDAQLTAAATEGLGDVLKFVLITEGAIRALDIDTAAVTAAKADRSANGKQLLTGGQEQDNDRRQLLADNVLPGLRKYADKVRAAGAKDPASPKAIPSAVEVGAIVDKAIRGIRADVLNPVCDEELQTHLVELFPMLKSVSVQQMRLRHFDVEQGYFGRKKEESAASASFRDLLPKAQAALKDKPNPSRSDVQTLATAYAAEMKGQPEHRIDAILTDIFTAVLGPTLTELTFEQGRLTAFQMGRKRR